MDTCLYYVTDFVSKRIAQEVDCSKCDVNHFHVTSIYRDNTYSIGLGLVWAWNSQQKSSTGAKLKFKSVTMINVLSVNLLGVQA